MKFGLEGAINGLPAFLGVVIGVRAFTGGTPWILGCIIVASLSFAAMMFGRGNMHRWPRAARWFIEVWILASICIVALATGLILFLSTTQLTPLLGNASDPDTNKTISATFIGAATAYLAMMWTKDIGDATGDFWPSTQFKKGMLDAAEMLDKVGRKPAGATKVSEAMGEDTVADYGEIGWGFSARGIRAKILAGYL